MYDGSISLPESNAVLDLKKMLKQTVKKFLKIFV